MKTALDFRKWRASNHLTLNVVLKHLFTRYRFIFLTVQADVPPRWQDRRRNLRVAWS